MATEVDLDELLDKATEGDAESGKGLRKQLKAVLAENRDLRKQVVASKAAELIRSKGYDLVETKDLPDDVSLDDVEAKLEALHKERTDILAKGIRAQYVRQGVEGEDLDAAVEEFLAGRATSTTREPETEQFERVRRLAGVAGDPVPAVNTERLHGPDAIRAAFESRSRSKK